MFTLTFTPASGKRAKAASGDTRLVLDESRSDLPKHDGKHPYIPVTLPNGATARLAVSGLHLYVGSDTPKVGGATVELQSGTVTIADAAPAPAAAPATGGMDLLAALTATGNVDAVAAYIREMNPGMDARRVRTMAGALVGQQ